jgi:hypothetical protein
MPGDPDVGLFSGSWAVTGDVSKRLKNICDRIVTQTSRIFEALHRPLRQVLLLVGIIVLWEQFAT